LRDSPDKLLAGFFQGLPLHQGLISWNNRAVHALGRNGKNSGASAMAPNPQLEPRPKAAPRNRDLAHRSSQDVNGPLIAILAIIAFAFVLSLVLTVDWGAPSDFPTVTETLPAPDINSTVPPAPGKPPAPAQNKT
jgi:hypothetical protein